MVVAPQGKKETEQSGESVPCPGLAKAQHGCQEEVTGGRCVLSEARGVHNKKRKGILTYWTFEANFDEKKKKMKPCS